MGAYFKSFTLSALGVAALFGTAHAGDGPYSYSTFLPWTGFYIGAHAGVGFADDTHIIDLDDWNLEGEVTPLDGETEFLGGGQIGYNHQFQSIVLGIEADISGFDYSEHRIPDSSFFNTGSDIRTSVEMEWLATVRGRLGVAFWDRVLLYGTAGAAFTDGEFRYHDFCNTGGCGGGLIDARGEFDTGWTAGGGVEVAITPNWLIKSEYLFVQFDGERFPGFDEDNGDRFEFSADDLDITSFALASITNSVGATRRLPHRRLLHH